MKKLRFKKDTVSKAFSSEIEERAKARLGVRHLNTGPNLVFWLKALFFFTLCWGSYALILNATLSGSAAIVAAAVVSLSGLLLGFAVGHDASHGVISRQKSINDLLHIVSFLTVGVDPTLWGLRHIRSHHLYPNVEGSDIDIDKNPLLRLSPTHPWKAMHRYQHLYASFAYALALAHSVFLGDWVYLLSKDYAWMRKGVSVGTLYFRFLAYKTLHFTLMILIPYAVLSYSLWQIFAVYLFAGALASLAFIIMLVGTHFFSEASFPEASSGKLQTSWAVHNLETSCDWNPDNAIARFISGGANCHAAHHLFPNMCHIHYGKLSDLILDVTNKHAVKYHHKSLWQMMRSHYLHLYEMGREPID